MNLEKLNEISCRADSIENNDKILIGGSFYGKLDLAVTADTENFENFFKTVEVNAKNFENNDSMKKWLDNVAPSFDAKLFAHLYAFDNILRKIYPNMSSNISKRQSFYDTDGSKKLSQSFNEGVCQCAEIAVLAQVYLQRQNFETKYFGGELLRKPTEEFGEPHSFISIKTDKNEYFYDPANPTISSGMLLPKISTIEATPTQKRQFENKIHTTSERRNCAFLEARDVFTKSSWYYGCGDGFNIFPSFIFSKNNIQKQTSSEKTL